MSQRPNQPHQEDTNHLKTSSGGGRQLLKSSGIVSLMTLMSRFLGLARDVIIANYFGTRADAFFVAFKIPNFFRRLFAEGAFSVAFVPVLSEYKATKTLQDVQHLAAAVAGQLSLILGVITIIAVAGAPVLTAIFAPGYWDDQEKFWLTADLLRITFPYLFLISMTAFAGGVLNTYGKFAVPAVTPLLLNISLIASTVLLTPYFAEPLMALAWGVFIAGVAQLVFQFPFLWQLRMLQMPKFEPKHPGVKQIITLMIPVLFGASVSQLNLLLDVLLASLLEDGSVSWLYYSDRLSQLPLGIFAIAIAVVILPSLSEKYAKAEPEKFVKTLDWGFRMVCLIGLPATLALIAIAEPLLATIFHRGAITEYDIEKMALSLRAYAAGLMAFMWIKVLAPGYFARQDTKTPVKIGLKAVVANMILNLPLAYYFAHMGLALATTLSAYLNAGLLLAGLLKAGHYQFQKGWMVFIVRLILANLLMWWVIDLLSGDSARWLEMGEWNRIGEILIVVAAGVGTYGMTLLLLGLRPRHFRVS